MISCFTDGKLGPCASLNEAVRGAVIASGYSTPTTRTPERGKRRRCLLMHSKQDDECTESPCGVSASFKHIFVFLFLFSLLLWSVVNHSYASVFLNRLQAFPMPLWWFDWHVICIRFGQWSTKDKVLKILQALLFNCLDVLEVCIYVCVCMSRGLESYEIGMSLHIWQRNI